MQNFDIKTIKNIRARLETVLGITLLEYHDMNLLSGDPKSRNEEQQKILTYAIGDCITLERQMEAVGRAGVGLK